MAHAKPEFSYVTAGLSGIAVLVPTDSRFLPTISEWLDEQTLQSVQPILPYSILLRNESDQGIVSVCVRWVLTDNQDRQIVQTMSLQSLINDRSRMQLPNAFVFMSPQPGLNRPVTNGQNAKIANTFRWNDLSLFQSQRTITVEVDSIVFEDGRLFGRDFSKTMEKLNSWLRADEPKSGG